MLGEPLVLIGDCGPYYLESPANRLAIIYMLTNLSTTSSIVT